MQMHDHGKDVTEAKASLPALAADRYRKMLTGVYNALIINRHGTMGEGDLEVIPFGVVLCLLAKAGIDVTVPTDDHREGKNYRPIDLIDQDIY